MALHTPTRVSDLRLARHPRGVRRWVATHRPLTILVGITLSLTVAIGLFPDVVPVNTLMVPLFLGPLFLAPRHLAVFALLQIAALGVATLRQPEFNTRRWVALGIIFVLALFALAISLRRARLGVAGVEGEAMLVDLRDRIQAQGHVPALPANWQSDSLVRAAGGTPFSGDFFCYHARRDQRLDVVLVDVSGKGVKAGARALQLSSALNGLLGAVEPAELLPAVNVFLLRQDWQEGFATAVHLSLDLQTGQYDLYVAGHPPPLIIDAVGGIRRIEQGGGPLLGLLDGATYPPATGELLPGAVIVLYTDGLVESAGLDIDTGIDEFAGIVANQVREGIDGIADRVISASGGTSDDRAVLVVGRT